MLEAHILSMDMLRNSTRSSRCARLQRTAHGLVFRFAQARQEEFLAYYPLPRGGVRGRAIRSSPGSYSRASRRSCSKR